MSFLSFFQKPAATPSLTPLSLTSPTDILNQYLSQGSQIPALTGMANQLNAGQNAGVQQQLSAVDPSLMGNVKQLGTNTSSLLSGQIPQDVIDQITRNSAYQSLSGGFGGSGMSHALTAEDLGLSSLQLQQQGTSNLNMENGLDQSLTPGRASAANMLLTPSSLQSADYSADQFNNGITNQNAMIKYQNSLRQSPFQQVVSNTIGSLVSTPFNFIQSGDSVVGNAPSIFAQMLAGSAAGGGSAGGKSGGGGGGLLGGGLLALL